MPNKIKYKVSVSIFKALYMARMKAVGFSVSVTTKKKYAEYIEGYLTKDQALKMAMRLATSTNKVEIDREYEKIYPDGEIEPHSKPYGVLKMVKRKAGNAYVLQTFDAYGWDSYTYDVMPDGRLKNRR